MLNVPPIRLLTWNLGNDLDPVAKKLVRMEGGRQNQLTFALVRGRKDVRVTESRANALAAANFRKG